jgi:hypothetical protein
LQACAQVKCPSWRLGEKGLRLISRKFPKVNEDFVGIGEASARHREFWAYPEHRCKSWWIREGFRQSKPQVATVG